MFGISGILRRVSWVFRMSGRYGVAVPCVCPFLATARPFFFGGLCGLFLAVGYSPSFFSDASNGCVSHLKLHSNVPKFCGEVFVTVFNKALSEVVKRFQQCCA